MVCSFTGHRQIEPAHRAGIRALLLRAIEYAYLQGCRDFMTGGALGFDTLAAREVIAFRISHSDVRLIMALPCAEQDARWSDAERESYNYTLAVADEVIYVSDSYTKDCMAKRNRYLAESADILIAYLGRTISGAAQTVRMAEKLGKKIYNLYPTLDKKR